MWARTIIIYALAGMICCLFQCPQVFAQNITQIEYFINTDPGFGSATPLTGFTASSNISAFTGNIDISTAPDGINALYVRSKDANGKWSFTNTIPFIKIDLALPDIVEAEYFLDTLADFGTGTPIPVTPSVNISGLTFQADVSTVGSGLHTIYLRAKDANGDWSFQNSIPFIKGNLTVPDIVKAEYFIDTVPGFGMGTSIPITPSVNISGLTFQADVSAVNDGFHMFYMRGKDAYGNWGLLNTIPFIKGNINVSDIIQAEYFIDNDPGFGNATNVPVTPTPNITGMNFTADLSSVSFGIHTFFVRAKNSDGKWNITNTVPFVKQGMTVAHNIIAMEYFVDTDPGFGLANAVAGFTPSADIISFNFDVDVTADSAGNHNLYIRAKDTSGTWSLTNVISFNKPVGTGITQVTQLDNTFEVYPNPGNGNYNITISKGIDPVKLEIIDVSGKVVCSLDTPFADKTIDITNIANGYYFFRVFDTRNNCYYKKVHKQ